MLKVIQRRGDFGEPREDFNRDWADYKHGFGDHNKEFWLGNEQIHQLTKAGNMKLRVELEAHDGKTAWAEFDTFRWVGFIKFDFFNDRHYPGLRERTRDTSYTLEATQALQVTAWRAVWLAVPTMV